LELAQAHERLGKDDAPAALRQERSSPSTPHSTDNRNERRGPRKRHDGISLPDSAAERAPGLSAIEARVACIEFDALASDSPV
jgi:hypothetical protein